MKCIIQIPCFNEAETLPVTLAHLPRRLPGFDVVEWLVIDDGSRDATAEVARSLGVDHVVRHPRNQGLASAFITGLRECLARGADVIVNTDADNQYCAGCIPDLVAPIVDGRAQIVVGVRSIDTIEDFSPLKKLLQKLGSAVVRLASRTSIADAPSGFRAISRQAALQLNVFSNYTYTLETIIQAGQKGIPIIGVPIKTNPFLRKSRLVRSIPSYLWRSASTIVRIFAVYQPFRFFATLGTISLSLGVLLGLRFVYYFLLFGGEGKIQSLILAAILCLAGFQLFMAAFVADLLAVNRKLLEELQFRMRERDPQLESQKEAAEVTKNADANP